MQIAPRVCTVICLLFLSGAAGALAQSPYATSTNFAKHANLLRQNGVLSTEPRPLAGMTLFREFPVRYGWKSNIVTTVFWIGELPAPKNPVSNASSSWDPAWQLNYGGVDDPLPAARRDYIPIRFAPRQNPFYCALPYNDVQNGETKPEAPRVIPWFQNTFTRSGKSVCQNRWVAIRKGTRVAYAQWSDCGPFATDHHAYVFGNERPRPNLNRGAGLDVSPSVRDYLGLQSTDVTDWKFVEVHEVPSGPWTRHGQNNDFVVNKTQRARLALDNISRKPE